jgi:hypothetical protein
VGKRSVMHQEVENPKVYDASLIHPIPAILSMKTISNMFKQLWFLENYGYYYQRVDLFSARDQVQHW